LRRHLTIGFVAAAFAAVLAPASALASVTITVEPAPGEDVFSPSSATLDLGDGTFDWQWGPNGQGATDQHNVLQQDALFTSGEPVPSRPPYRLAASAGSYFYYCTIHVGMNGDVNVRPALTGASAASSSDWIDFGWATEATTTGSRYDVRYRTGKKWKTWLKKTKKKSGKFGKRKKPVKVKKGRTYEFQARSRQGSVKSGWSPSLVVEP
jgi:plastocyanin